MRDVVQKINRLNEIKRQIGNANKRIERGELNKKKLDKERKKILDSFTDDEIKMYKDRIEKAYQI